MLQIILEAILMPWVSVNSEGDKDGKSSDMGQANFI